MTGPHEENTSNLDGVIVPQEDALPGPSRRGHAKLPTDIVDDVFEAAEAAELAQRGLAEETEPRR